MTALRDWIASRKPEPPAQLARRLAEIVGDETFNGASSANILIDRGVETLRSVTSDREGALDLLAADALITYAMEAAADDLSTMGSTAAVAIQRIARGTV